MHSAEWEEAVTVLFEVKFRARKLVSISIRYILYCRAELAADLPHLKANICTCVYRWWMIPSHCVICLFLFCFYMWLICDLFIPWQTINWCKCGLDPDKNLDLADKNIWLDMGRISGIVAQWQIWVKTCINHKCKADIMLIQQHTNNNIMRTGQILCRLPSELLVFCVDTEWAAIVHLLPLSSVIFSWFVFNEGLICLGKSCYSLQG